MKIGVDLDDVLAELLIKFTDFHNKKNSTNFKFEQITHFGLWELWGITKDEMTLELEEFLENHSHTVEPILGSVEAIDELAKNHELLILTSRSESMKDRTIEWLNIHYPAKFQDFLFANHWLKAKGKTKADLCRDFKIELVIEDSPLFAKELAEQGFKVVLFDKLWNQGLEHNNIIRADSWSEIVKKLK